MWPFMPVCTMPPYGTPRFGRKTGGGAAEGGGVLRGGGPKISFGKEAKIFFGGFAAMKFFLPGGRGGHNRGAYNRGWHGTCSHWFANPQQRTPRIDTKTPELIQNPVFYKNPSPFWFFKKINFSIPV